MLDRRSKGNEITSFLQGRTSSRERHSLRFQDYKTCKIFERTFGNVKAYILYTENIKVLKTAETGPKAVRLRHLRNAKDRGEIEYIFKAPLLILLNNKNEVIIEDTPDFLYRYVTGKTRVEWARSVSKGQEGWTYRFPTLYLWSELLKPIEVVLSNSVEQWKEHIITTDSHQVEGWDKVKALTLNL